MNEPSLLYFLFTIAGAAALLIWSARLVRTGVEDAFAIPLRRFCSARISAGRRP